MGEVTGRIIHRPIERGPFVGRDWTLDSRGRVNGGDNQQWFFRRRIDAVAFAKRKGIRLETQ